MRKSREDKSVLWTCLRLFPTARSILTAPTCQLRCTLASAASPSAGGLAFASARAGGMEGISFGGVSLLVQPQTIHTYLPNPSRQDKEQILPERPLVESESEQHLKRRRSSAAARPQRIFGSNPGGGGGVLLRLPYRDL